MQAWSVAGMVLGLAAAAGVNLYLSALVVGVSIRLGLVDHYPAELTFLSQDWVIAIAGALYSIEFFADKIPWVDSVWDAIHTVIRPAGAAFLAIRTLGSVEPALDVIAGLAGGAVSLSTHGTKATTRLLANHSPEPFSNIALSFTEDGLVLVLSWMAFHHPLIALTGVLIFLVVFVYYAPKIARHFVSRFKVLVAKVRFWTFRERPLAAK